MKKLLDLRFVIGMFFLIVGVLLFIYHFTGIKNPEMNSMVNLWTGIVFIIFGSVMTFLSYSHADTNDEPTEQQEN